MLYAAIDIHKHAFQAAVLDPDSGEVVEERFAADRDGLARWAEQWRGRVEAVAIEATTGIVSSGWCSDMIWSPFRAGPPLPPHRGGSGGTRSTQTTPTQRIGQTRRTCSGRQGCAGRPRSSSPSTLACRSARSCR